MLRHDILYSCLVETFNVYDDVAAKLCVIHKDLITQNEDEDTYAICDLILEAERKRLGVEELPREDYFCTVEELLSDTDDEPTEDE